MKQRQQYRNRSRYNSARSIPAEMLEQRLCLADDLAFALHDQILSIYGTEHADQIDIQQDDHLDIVTVRLRRDSTNQGTTSEEFRGTFSSSEIRSVKVETRGGDDRVEIDIVNGDMIFAKEFGIDLGEANDVFQLRSLADGDIRAALQIDLHAGSGNDQFFASLGGIGDNAPVEVSAELGAGDDTSMLIVGDIADRLNTRIDGGSGNDHVTIRAVGDVADSAAGWNAQLIGQDGDDRLDIDVQGRMTEETIIGIHGGRGNDQLGLALVDTSAHDHPHVQLVGDDGDDDLRIVFGASTDPVGTAAHGAVIVEGGPGIDSLQSPGDVAATGIESAHSVDSWRSTVDKWIDPLLNRLQGAGIFVGIVTHDGVREAYSYGTARRDGTLVTPYTAFEVGSITKTFTSLLLADMVERGEVGLDDPLRIHLPTDAVVPRRGDREITLRELATHTSGLPRDTHDFDRLVAAVSADFEQGVTNPDNLLALLTAEWRRGWWALRSDLLEITLPDVDQAPVQYSNLGMGLLGYALSHRLGTDYEQALRERVLQPLGLKDTFQSFAATRADQIAEGIAFDGQTPVPPALFDTLSGAGALRATGWDLLRYLESQLGRAAGPLASAMALTQRAQASIDADGSQAVGLGWITSETPFGKVVGHNGATFGFQSEIVFNATTGSGFVMLMNSVSDALESDIQSLFDQLSSALLLTHHPQPMVPQPAIDIRWNSVTDSVEIHGTADGDAIEAVVDGDAGLLTVTSRGTDGTRYARRFSLDRLQGVNAQLGAGDDEFELRTRGDIGRDLRLNILAGDDNDAVRLELGTDGGRIGAHLTSLIRLGAGDDGLGIRAWSLSAGGTVSVDARLGSGDDALQLESQNPGVAAASFSASIFGEAGNDELYAFTLDELAVGASSRTKLDGGPDDDTLMQVAKGTVGGRLVSRVAGGAGDDTILLDGSGLVGEGNAVLFVTGDMGDDRLSLLSAPIGSAAAIAILDGGDGNDIEFTPNPVWSLRTEAPGSPPAELMEFAASADTFHRILPTSVVRIENQDVEYWTGGASAPDRPIVVLISGGGDSLDTWVPIAEQLAAVGQVIAINRPGYGASDPLDNYTGENITRLIRDVVGTIAPNRRLLLVGHSFGGVLANLYARQYPQAVAGVIFNDSSHPRQLDVYREIGFLEGIGESGPFSRISSRGPRDDGQHFESILQETQQAGPFPAIPVIALTTTPPDGYPGLPAAVNAALVGLQTDLAQLGSPGQYRYVPEAGHYIHRDQPTAVVGAVMDLWSESIR